VTRNGDCVCLGLCLRHPEILGSGKVFVEVRHGMKDRTDRSLQQWDCGPSNTAVAISVPLARTGLDLLLPPLADMVLPGYQSR
jgi:hypothetical protein